MAIILVEMKKTQLCFEPLQKLELTKNEKILELKQKEIKITLGESEYQKEQKRLAQEVRRKQTELLERSVVSREYLNYEIIGESYEQCVVYAHRVTGNDKVRGWAGSLSVDGDIPQVGSVVKTWEGGGHVGIVIEIEGDYILINDANYRRGYITQRKLNINSSLIAGYIY